MNDLPKYSFSRSQRRDGKSALAPLTPLLCLLFGLAHVSAQTPGESVTAIDKALVVDCKLPPQVRQLGLNKTMLMPGAIQRESKAACEIRGGLYVAYDAADPATALKIWMDSANQGDAQAQNRVGQIYELGIGLAPDYNQAAKWYEKAAQNGSRPAAINLASLYDRALAAPKNNGAASALYRKALGLTPADPRPPGVARASESADLLDVGSAAGAKPTITLQDPSLAVTRGDNEVRLRADVKTKDINGRVIAKSGVASLRINDRDVAVDRFGYFATSIAVSPGGTKVSIVAIDTQGARDEAVFVLRSGATGESVVPRKPPQLPSGRTGDFFALVIGNRHYKDSGWRELPNSESDARSVASLLARKYGFANPRLLIDATREQILGALNDYVKTLGPADNLLIYYAGHGAFKLGKRGYWIPVDGGKEDDTNWIDNVRIADVLLKMKARKVLLVSDSCYAAAMIGTVNGGVATIRPGLSDGDFVRAAGRLVESTSRTVLGSGGLAPVIEDGAKNHSVFASAFLDTLEANSVPMEGYRLFLALEGKVIKLAHEKRFEQAPVYAGIALGGHEGGDFVFVPKATRPGTAMPYGVIDRLAMGAR